MELESVTLPDLPESPLPETVANFLATADERLQRFLEEQDAPRVGFYPSDYPLVYGALRRLRHGEPQLRTFCEWGSGLGVATGLASLLSFDACGIEINERLAEESRELLSEFDLPVEIHTGSFIPEDYEPTDVDDDAVVTVFLQTDVGAVVDVDPIDIDVFFAFPWPGEEEAYFDIFAQHAAEGATLVTYHGMEGITVQRKMG